MDAHMKMLNASMEGLNEALPDDKKGLMDKMAEVIFAAVTVSEIKTHPDYPGYRVAPPFNFEVVDWTKKNWVPRSSDVIVASFPKTGTTWTREIVRRILYKGDEASYMISKHSELPFFGYLEAGSPVKYEIQEVLNLKRTLWGTHLASELLNMEAILKSGCKVIYVMRNPKDTVVSYKKFLEKMPMMKHEAIKKFFPDDIESYVKQFISGKIPNLMKEGEWYPHHIASWWKYKNHPNVHFVFYEHMKQNPSKEIEKISNHIGVTLTKDELDLVVQQTSFNTMKEKASLAMQAHNMFRKGGIGNWREHFSEEVGKTIEVEMNKALGDIKIDFIYS